MAKKKIRSKEEDLPDKSKHVSYNLHFREAHIDNFNIDFLRYYNKKEFFFALLGSFLGFLLWRRFVFLSGYFDWLSLNQLYLLVVAGGVCFFLITTFIAHLAVNNIVKSARIVGRRGLFTFTVMAVTFVLLSLLTGAINKDTLMLYVIRYFLICIMLEAVFAVPLDYGLAFVAGLWDKKDKKIR